MCSDSGVSDKTMLINIRRSPHAVVHRSLMRTVDNRRVYRDLIATLHPTDHIERNHDHRPRGISRPQLELDQSGFGRRLAELSLLFFLNGPVGYRTDSEDSKRAQGSAQAKTDRANLLAKSAAVNPDICLERRSIRIPMENYETVVRVV